MNELNAPKLYSGFMAAATQLIENKDILNKINFFPVADRDTGSNLAASMRGITDGSHDVSSVSDLMTSISKGLIMASRGNSGIIFSQYLSGFASRCVGLSVISLADFSVALDMATETAYKALENPIEGTILTLMSKWSELIALESKKHDDFFLALNETMPALEKTLNDTAGALSEYKKQKLVDSGALAFYYFVLGFRDGLSGEVTAVTLPDFDEFINHDNHDLTYRYCTEVLFEAPNYNTDVLRESLSLLGDSLIISESDDYYRVHIHTNTPVDVVRLLPSDASLRHIKSDDMSMQVRVSSAKPGKIAIVSDSIADGEFEHEDFYRLPLNLLMDGVTYLDKRSIDNAFVYEHDGKVSSSQVNEAQVLEFLEPILSVYDEIYILSVSSKMSGTYGSFKRALDSLDLGDKKVHLVDSKTNSAAQGLLVNHALRLVDEGVSYDALISQMDVLKNQARIYVSIDDIGPMARSGRIPKKVGSVLISLGFRPIVSIDASGEGSIDGLAFSKKKNAKLFEKKIRNSEISEYVLAYTSDKKDALEWEDKIFEMTGVRALQVVPTSAIVAMSAGQHSVAIAFIDKNKKGE